MESRRVSLVLLISAVLLLGMVIPPNNQNGIVQRASAQSPETMPSYIELGFSPTTLSSTQSGVPVYAPGDSMWFLTSSNQVTLVTLTSPSGSSVASKSVSLSSVIQIYTFAKTDIEGNWLLKIFFRNSTSVSLTIPFVSSFSHPVGLSLSKYSIQGAQLNLGFSISPSNAYDLIGCLAPKDANGTVELSLPSSVGSGLVAITSNLHSSSVSTKQASQLNQFTFWYTMDYSYSYSGNVSGEYLSRDIEAVSSSSVVFSSSSSQTLSLTNETSLRPGEYTMRAFFDSSAGLSVEETNVLLLTSGSWLWLDECNPFQITSSSFTRQVSLSQPTSAWPSTVYVIYQVDGVGGYTVSNLQVSPARIDFIGEPGNTSLPYLSYAVSNELGLQTYGTFDGSIYLVGSSFPVTLKIVPSFGNETLPPEIVSVSNPFTSTLVKVPVGKLVVYALNNSIPAVSAQIGVANGAGGTLTQSVNTNGSATFYLPSGTYNVSVTGSGIASSKNASLSIGNETLVEFTFTSNQVVNYLPALLGSILVVGVLLNVWAWLIRPKRKYSFGSV